METFVHFCTINNKHELFLSFECRNRRIAFSREKYFFNQRKENRLLKLSIPVQPTKIKAMPARREAKCQ